MVKQISDKEVKFLRSQVLVSQDLSCFGQVSLQTALPLISASGANVSTLPTALLSTHTGGFAENTYLDLSLEMARIITHWQKLKLTFDGVYLGYLGLKPLKELQKSLSTLTTPKTLVLIDPVMGDNGHLYHGFDQEYVNAMKELIQRANILTPNLTEAAFLLDQRQLLNGGIKEASIAVKQLQERFGIPFILITGVPLANDQIAVVGCQKTTGEIWVKTQTRFPASYFGTGDIFAAALFAAVISGHSIQLSCDIALELLHMAIRARQEESQSDPRVGLNYNSALPKFLKQLAQGETNDRR